MGLFITFEGVEGCGKSTQSKLLSEYLLQQNYEVLQTREPGGPIISEHIRKILLDPCNKAMVPETEVLLYAASRSQHTAEWIIPAKNSDKIIICDRYYDSTVAYQGAARSILPENIEFLNRFASFGITPDITFIIDIPIEMSRQRIRNKNLDRLEQENIDFHKRVRDGFLKLAKSSERFYLINGVKHIEEIHQEIVRKISLVLKDGK